MFKSSALPNWLLPLSRVLTVSNKLLVLKSQIFYKSRLLKAYWLAKNLLWLEQALDAGTKQSRWPRKAGRLTRQAGPTRQAGWQGRQTGKAGILTRQAGWQGRWADKAGGLIRQVGWQGRWADKAGGLTRQGGWQGRWADKAGGLTRQVGQQGNWIGWTDMPALTANTTATTTDIHKKTRVMCHSSVYF